MDPEAHWFGSCAGVRGGYWIGNSIPEYEGMTHMPDYMRYWGKSAGGEHHPLPFHSLDVAAVGEALLDMHPTLGRQLARLTHLDENTLRVWAVYLLALHDVGKFSVDFQNLDPALLRELQDRTSRNTYSGSARHDTLGYVLWHERLAALFADLGLIERGSGRSPSCAKKALDTWFASVTGHHGTPPQQRSLLLGDHFESVDQEAAVHFARDAGTLLLPGSTRFPDIDETALASASWWLAGFTVLCDWIGSNTDYFPRCPHGDSMDEYLAEARAKARQAISATGLLPATPTRVLTLSQLLPGVADVTYTPLQRLAEELPIEEGPQLFLLEEVTGAGKTEAALLLARRLMAAGKAHGIYLGLPTMATANAMYRRLGSHACRKLYNDDTPPSLVLAHAAAFMSEEFRQSIVPAATRTDGSYLADEPTASTHCSEWLADNRKKALLADIGIGTIDQALLAILPSRHQSLRLLGLLDKVLVVDEVHACDAYMNRLLRRLLEAHATAGGSAILLSATLPREQRQALVNSFQRGIQGIPGRLESRAYPLLTSVSGNATREVEVARDDSAGRQVIVEHVDSIEGVENVIEGALRAGQCVCWIRNTVVDACESFDALREVHPDWDIDLFHARFALADRLDIENRVLERFGKQGGHKQRKGWLLIATQVVEQSLDIDFDSMITDLAPIDLMIQRAGRLRRHRRNTRGDPVGGRDQRGTPTLHVHAPPWNDEPEDDWFAGPFARAGMVYPDHGQLWLTLGLLRDQRGFRMPNDARNLIEGVYGTEVDVPEGLVGRHNRAQGDARARASVGDLNVLDIDKGYTDPGTNRWWDDTRTPTRLGDPTTTIWLARWEGGVLFPWRDEGPFHWHQSSLSIAGEFESIIDLAGTAETKAAEVERCVQSLPKGGKWGVLLAMTQVDGDTWEGAVASSNGSRIFYEYQKDIGLSKVKSANRKTPRE